MKWFCSCVISTYLHNHTYFPSKVVAPRQLRRLQCPYFSHHLEATGGLLFAATAAAVVIVVVVVGEESPPHTHSLPAGVGGEKRGHSPYVGYTEKKKTTQTQSSLRLRRPATPYSAASAAASTTTTTTTGPPGGVGRRKQTLR